MTSPAPRHRVVVVDGVPASALAVQAPVPRAVIVAIHGGATTSAYFDCPGRPDLSLLRAAVARGFTAIALDRPGYGASAVYAADFADVDRRVAFASAAVDKILASSDRGAGLFLLGHSAGCELALRLATSRDDVIGVEISGTGLRYSDMAKSVISQSTVTRRPAGLRELLWQPANLYPPEVLTSALSAPGAAYEAEVTTNWTRRSFPDIAARVTVPVSYTVADHEKVWETSAESLASIVGQFGAAPRVALGAMADSGHNLSVGFSAVKYHHRVMSFIEDCIAAEDGRDTRKVEAS